MAACLLLAVPLLVRRRIGRWQTFGLVLLGDLVYVVVALCSEDPVRYATPLMLLFPALVAAWFLRPWMLAVNMVAVPLAVVVAPWGGGSAASCAPGAARVPRRWRGGVTVVAVPLAVLVALWSSYPDPVGLAVQVGVNAGLLDLVAVAVHVLRRRERRLPAAAAQLPPRGPPPRARNRPR